MEKDWQKQRRIFRILLMLLDEATIVAFVKEVEKIPPQRLYSREIEKILAEIFRNLREKDLDRATMGYIRMRIDSWYTLCIWGFERRMLLTDSRRGDYTDETNFTLWANYLLWCVKNRDNLDPYLICDCGAWNCEHFSYYFLH